MLNPQPVSPTADFFSFYRPLLFILSPGNIELKSKSVLALALISSLARLASANGASAIKDACCGLFVASLSRPRSTAFMLTVAPAALPLTDGDT